MSPFELHRHAGVAARQGKQGRIGDLGARQGFLGIRVVDGVAAEARVLRRRQRLVESRLVRRELVDAQYRVET
jgi:hypothetical protein